MRTGGDLTSVTTAVPFSDRCLSTYTEDSRSLEAERRDEKVVNAESCVFPPLSFKSHSVTVSACLWSLERRASER